MAVHVSKVLGDIASWVFHSRHLLAYSSSRGCFLFPGNRTSRISWSWTIYFDYGNDVVLFLNNIYCLFNCATNYSWSLTASSSQRTMSQFFSTGDKSSEVQEICVHDLIYFGFGYFRLFFLLYLSGCMLVLAPTTEKHRH